MRWSELPLERTLPFDERKLSAADRAIWRSFPADFRRALAKTNGGTVTGRPTFSTRIRRVHDGKLVYGQTNWLTELWAFLPRAQRPRVNGPRSILREHFGRHVAEEFLPSGVFVFGMCEQSCLVAISTNARDRGAIYYWEWYWQYPWYMPFFEERIDRVRKRWPKRKQMGPDHPDYPRMRDDFNYATLVKIAPSFTTWVERMRLGEKR